MRSPGQNRYQSVTPTRPGSRLSVAHLAHELNSLLDGSIRCLALAQRVIDESPMAQGGTSPAIIERLRAAHQGMNRMAELLNRAMKSPLLDCAIFEDPQPLKAVVTQIVESLAALAAEHDVHLEVDLTPRAAALPALSLGPVILNGLRNAIEACACSDVVPRRVELSVTITPTEELLILIADTGTGIDQFGDEFACFKPGGHGFGLELSKQIVESLGGRLDLANIPFASGAVLQVTIPLRSFRNNG